MKFALYTMFAVALSLTIHFGSVRTSLAFQSQTSNSPGAHPQSSDADPDTLLARADASLKAGDLEGAEREYESYLALRPDAAQVRSNLGVVLAHLGKHQEAIAQYQKALAGNVSALSPQAIQSIRFNLALAYYKSGQFAEAADQFASLQRAQPENLRLALLLADCHFRMGEYQKVISSLSPLQRDHGHDNALLYLLGMSFLRSHQVKQAEAVMDPILRNGDSPQAHMLLGAAERDKTQYHEAQKDFERAIELDPRLPSAHFLLGLTYLDMGSHEKAIAAFRDELAQNPNDFESNLYLGAVLKTDENYAASLPYLRRAVEIQPDNVAPMYQLGTLYMATGKLQEARQELEEVTKRAPQLTEAHVSLARVYYRLKDKEGADRERAILQKLNAAAQQAKESPLPAQ